MKPIRRKKGTIEHELLKMYGNSINETRIIRDGEIVSYSCEGYKKEKVIIKRMKD